MIDPDAQDGSGLYAVIAGGGTGGHVNPALAIADALVERGHIKNSLMFVGSARGLEARLVPEAGYNITLLPGRGISRSIGWQSVVAIIGLLKALVMAVGLLRKHRPSVVVSVGGYAAAPCAFGAVILRIPLVLAESNAMPGAVHRLAGRFAKASAVALPETKLPRAVVTGNPLRGIFSDFDSSAPAKAQARSQLDIATESVVIACFGGSLGARSINIAVIEMARQWAELDNVVIVHVIGSRDWVSKEPELDHEAATRENPRYRAIEYEPHMARLLSAADIAVCRSGATTVAELAVVGIGSVLVPYPFAAGDHQSANAATLEKVGAAKVLADSQCNAQRLMETLKDFVESKKLREDAAHAAHRLAVPDAAQKVAELVERCASK